MPVGFLSTEQARRFDRFAGEPTPDQLARHFHLDDADRAFVAEHRGNHNRLGIAAQLGAVRHTGAFADELTQVPRSALRYVADQLGMDDGVAALTAYVGGEARWRHRSRIRERYGYREFTEPGVAFRLNRFLCVLCWTGADRPSALFDRDAAWLVAAKVLLPGTTVLERQVARTRTLQTNDRPTKLARALRELGRLVRRSTWSATSTTRDTAAASWASSTATRAGTASPAPSSTASAASSASATGKARRTSWAASGSSPTWWCSGTPSTWTPR